MDGEDGLHLRRQRGGELSGAQVEGVFIRLHEHRTQPVLGDGEERSDVGVGRDRDRIAIFEEAQLFPATQGEDEGGKSVRRADTMRQADPSGELSLEGLHLFTEHIPTRIDDAVGGCFQFGRVPGVDRLQVEERDVHDFKGSGRRGRDCRRPRCGEGHPS